MTRICVMGDPVAKQRSEGGGVKLTTFIPLKIRKRSVRKVIIRPETGEKSVVGRSVVYHDSPMQVALSKAFYWQRLIEDGMVTNGTEIAKLEGLHHSSVNEVLRLTLLEPAIIQAILAGRQPQCMSLLWFQRNPLPTDWLEQRRIVAKFDA
jgi:hypothetical protein